MGFGRWLTNAYRLKLARHTESQDENQNFAFFLLRCAYNSL
jgi:hypothetical protein